MVIFLKPPKSPLSQSLSGDVEKQNAWEKKNWALKDKIIVFIKESIEYNVCLSPANSVGLEVSSGQCPCEPCTTNGLAMEKELYIASVGDAGSSGASESCICVLKPPRHL